ncbi:ImmA/IrrE family metallo-endopeptidase [Paenibacillus sp. GM2]|uniref:ImmA/IrrE family metallo-endopeptidase n=1 Tax=Paenibacillus sp. GM2 TaxID=1622070 RepID=UPI000839B520|nr:ImmA/IrrE family metallo-endopeptidase [Paenibacillus sp. GM2]
MVKHYRMTILEEFIEHTYVSAGITSPDQITIDELSTRLNVWVHYAEIGSRALEAVSGMYSMFIDSRLPKGQQRLDFLHELCHLLRHAGNQMTMPESYTQMQELEAEQFVLYAAMPSSMVFQLTPIMPTMVDAIPCLVDVFDVPPALAVKRIEQIKRRIIDGYRQSKRSEQKNRSHEPAWSRETKRVLQQLDRQLVAKGLPGYQDHGLI